MAAVQDVRTSPLSSIPIDSNGHPLLRTLLRYASAYASGVAISGGILSRRQEADAVFISLCYYMLAWQSLHSTRETAHEEHLQDLRKIIDACVSLEARLRTEEGSSDQVVLAEAIEEWACNGLRRSLSSLADMQRRGITQEAMRKRLRYEVSTTPYLPDPSAPAQAHAEFLTARHNACIPMLQCALENNRNQFTNEAQDLRASGDAMDLYNELVDTRVGEQIISYIYGTYCTIDGIGPSSFEQFMELSNDEKIRLIQRMVSAIEQSPPHELNATVRSMVEGIHSYLAITHSSREYRRQVADALLIYLIGGTSNLLCYATNGPLDAVIALTRKCMRYILRIVPPLRRLLNSLREQFRRDGLFEHMGFVDSIIDKLKADALAVQWNIEQHPNNTQATPDEPAFSNFPIPTRQNNKIFQDVSAEDLANMRNMILIAQNLIIENLSVYQAARHKQFLRSAFLTVHSLGQFLRFLSNIRPFPRITPPVATTSATTTSSSSSSSSSSTTTAQVSSPSPEPTTTSATTTTTAPPSIAPTPTPGPSLPELAATPLATTTTTTTIARSMPRRQRPALNDQPREPRKTSNTANWRTITPAQIRELSRPNLLRLIREMDLDVETGGGSGSHRKVRNKRGQVVAVLTNHPSQDTLSWPVVNNVHAAIQNAGKEKKSQ